MDTSFPGRQRGIPNRLLSMLFQAEPTFKPIDASATLFRGKALTSENDQLLLVRLDLPELHLMSIRT